MDKWAPIAPSKPGGPSGGPGVFSSFGSVLKPHKAGPSTSAAQRARAGPRVGRWPEDILVRIVGFLPVHDVPAFARANRALARIARHEGTWEARCQVLGITQIDKEAPPPQQTTPQPATTASPVAAAVASPKQGAGAQLPGSHGRKPSGSSRRLSVNNPKMNIGRVSVDDDWGDFGEAADDGVFEDVEFGDFAKPGQQQQPPPPIVPAKTAEKNLLDFGDMPLPSRPTGGAGAAGRTTGFFALTPTTPVPVATSGSPASASAPGPWYCTYRRRHRELVPYCVHLRNSPSPSSTLSLLFPPDPKTAITPSLSQQGDLLLALILFLDPRLQPVHDWGFLRQALLSAADRFDSTCLVAFEGADSKKDEESMRMAASASWKVWEAGGGRRDEWECGRVWVEKREVFYETGKWDASENIMKVPDPTGSAIVRELDFTPMDAFMAHVLESFRIDASTAVRVFPPGARVVLSFADKITMDVVGEYINTLLGQTRIMSPELSLRASAASFVQASKVVDVSMEVLGEDQKETPQSAIEQLVFTMFEPHMDEYLDDETEWVKGVLDGICNAWDAELGTDTKGKSSSRHRHKNQQNIAPQFLTSQNPDQVKRNVLAGFRDVLLLPVTIVPRTVTFVGKGIVSGSTQAVAGLSMLNPQKWAMGTTTDKGTPGKMVNGEVVFETDVVQPDDDEKDEVDDLSEAVGSTLQLPGGAANGGSTSVSGAATPNTAVTSGVGTPNPTGSPDGFANLQLLVSLDTALELIHGDRDALKRAETFAKYPGKCGAKVVDAIEEIFIQLLKAVGDRHIAPGFKIATDQMLTYKPAEHAETQSVAPLLQFFELVHVGDTIQSMTQVYFDKEIAQYVDKTDFLNPVMREKKRFEGVLDDAVAAGLNAGIEVLMNQVEHIIVVKTGPREYYPEPGAPMELGATVGCQEAIKCLEMHCNLLKGSTSKEVLEVFYQEVGIRLQGILQRHLKRQIISLDGGFQIIADLNAYHAFVQSLKQQRITDDFANLKMLGHVFIVSDAKDLAQIVRDVTRYGGTFTPEDIYEFIQRRSDWKKIEKTVDKAMYALSVREDCIVM